MRRFLLALVAGPALWLTFPGHGIWWLAPVGVAALTLATRGAGLRVGLLAGFVAGLGCFLPLLAWSNTYVGDVPWVALSVFEALYLALMGAAAAVLQTPRPLRVGRATAVPATVSRAPVRPVVVALLWVAQEALRGRAPFGGFPWGRLAFGQSGSPLVHLAAVGGAPLVTFAVALAGGLLAVAAQRLGPRLGERLGPRLAGRLPHAFDRAVLPALGALALAFTPGLLPLPTAGEGTPAATAQVLAVQGNVPRAGLEFNAQRRAVLDDHVAVTDAAAAAVKAGTRARPDLVLWPENSSDIDPYLNPDAATEIQQAADTVRAPILLGAVLERPAPNLSNASLLWEPTASGGGVRQVYVKQHPVPFAEYIPLRSFFRVFSSEVDLVRNDFVAGHSVGVFRVPLRSGTATGTATGTAAAAGQGQIAAGAVICFEVAYDDLVRNTVTAGANLIVVQTNNATFGYTDESVQQLAISQLRAVEHGRSVVHVSTVGVSALITPDGVAHQATAPFTAALLSGALPLRSSLTIADRLGGWPELAACAAVLLLLLRRPAFSRRGRLRSSRVQSPEPDGEPGKRRVGSAAGRGADPDLQRAGHAAPDRRATSGQRPGG